ncbi:MAG: transcriptional regulator [Dethiosulfovibrio peptidovorans]|nr:MAG: transcriptional regulator [Dethiosulfovibrio peptidovorans]
MKLSTKTRYGLRALIQLARNYNGNRPVTISQVANSEALPENYLEQLFSKLRRAELVSSVRGAHGGYFLSRHPRDIVVSDIIGALEGTIHLADCVDYGECKRDSYCPARILWEKLSRSIDSLTSQMTLQDVIDEYDQRRCELELP